MYSEESVDSRAGEKREYTFFSSSSFVGGLASIVVGVWGVAGVMVARGDTQQPLRTHDAGRGAVRNAACRLTASPCAPKSNTSITCS